MCQRREEVHKECGESKKRAARERAVWQLRTYYKLPQSTNGSRVDSTASIFPRVSRDETGAQRLFRDGRDRGNPLGGELARGELGLESWALIAAPASRDNYTAPALYTYLSICQETIRARQTLAYSDEGTAERRS